MVRQSGSCRFAGAVDSTRPTMMFRAASRMVTGRSALRIAPRTALVLGGSVVVGFSMATTAQADDGMDQIAKGVAVAGIAAAAYWAYSSSGPDYSECPPYNSAFVFLKPHAATPAAKALVQAGLEEKGYRILGEGELTGKEIDSKMYIDNHYYSIASKATILEPKELNVPAEKFAGKFGIGWQEALDQGVVYNALQACKKMGIDGAALDKKWAVAKKAGDLIKFGGGFYCAKIDGMYIFNGFFMEMRGKYTGDAKINWVSAHENPQAPHHKHIPTAKTHRRRHSGGLSLPTAASTCPPAVFMA